MRLLPTLQVSIQRNRVSKNVGMVCLRCSAKATSHSTLRCVVHRKSSFFCLQWLIASICSRWCLLMVYETFVKDCESTSRVHDLQRIFH